MFHVIAYRLFSLHFYINVITLIDSWLIIYIFTCDTLKLFNVFKTILYNYFKYLNLISSLKGSCLRIFPTNTKFTLYTYILSFINTSIDHKKSKYTLFRSYKAIIKTATAIWKEGNRREEALIFYIRENRRALIFT